MADPQPVTMPGPVWALAAAGPAGPLFVSSHDSSLKRVLFALDLAGRVMWRYQFDGLANPAATAEGTVWIAVYGSDSQTFTELGADGCVLRSITTEHELNEYVRAFVLLPDGFCALWCLDPRGQRVRPFARLARYERTGDIVWSTPLKLDQLSFPGVIEAGVHTGWEVRPMPPWRSRSVSADLLQPLLVSEDRALVGLRDIRSGIGKCSVVEIATGKIIATTEPAPISYKAIAGPGQFLVGHHGYGAFSTTLIDRDGRAMRVWPTDGTMVVDHCGVIRGPESDRHAQFRILNADGSMVDGPQLSGYYNVYPALDGDGNTVFFRHGKLLVVDSNLQLRELFSQHDVRAPISRVLLLAEGQVVFGLNDAVLIFRNTGLGVLDPGPWPCDCGNVQGNAAAFMSTEPL